MYIRSICFSLSNN